MLESVSRLLGSFSRLTSSRSSRSRFSLLSTRKSRTISSLIPSSSGCCGWGRGGSGPLAFPFSLRFFPLVATHTVPAMPKLPQSPCKQRSSVFGLASGLHCCVPIAACVHFPQHLFSFLQFVSHSNVWPPFLSRSRAAHRSSILFKSAAAHHSGTISFAFSHEQTLISWLMVSVLWLLVLDQRRTASLLLRCFSATVPPPEAFALCRTLPPNLPRHPPE
jgi:hypothetical protein